MSQLDTHFFFIVTWFSLAANAEHSDVIQSLSWKKDGTLLATSCKDKQVRILDPRLPANSFTHVANSHQSIKDSRVVWLGDASRILTTGFDSVSIAIIFNLIFCMNNTLNVQLPNCNYQMNQQIQGAQSFSETVDCLGRHEIFHLLWNQRFIRVSMGTCYWSPWVISAVWYSR